MAETTNTIVQDFIALQMELPKLQKTQENPFYHSKYVPLDQILDKVIPVINKHNFGLIQAVGHQDGEPTLVTKLVHNGGGEIASEMLLMVKTPDPQGQGSGITYARRYALVTMLGMTVGEDDDGNAATTAEAKAQEEARQQTSPKAVEELRTLLEGKGIEDAEDQKALLKALSNGQPLNTSGIARIRKEIITASPDTLAEVLANGS